MEGLVRLLHNTGQIPSGLGTRARCLVVLDEGAAEILPTVDGASRKCFEPVESLGTHHDREVGGHDVVVAASSSDGNGVGAQPRHGIRLAVVLLDPGRLEGGRPLDGPEPTEERGDAVEIVAGVVVDVCRPGGHGRHQSCRVLRHTGDVARARWHRIGSGDC